jgi:hypothetical protein
MTVTNSFRVSVYTAKGNEKVLACHSKKTKIIRFSKSETPILPPFAALETIGPHLYRGTNISSIDGPQN